MTEDTARVNGPVNVLALAALRPGGPISKVQEAMGDAWRPPAPHKGGRVDNLENSHGIRVWIDTNDVVGMIDYDHRFTQEVEGLRMGMSLKAAVAAIPHLKIGAESDLMPGVRYGTKVFPDGMTLTVVFTRETINGIAFTNPAAVYPEPTPPSYPAASGAPGAPFADINFKLVVLSSLLDAKVIDLGLPQQLATHMYGLRATDCKLRGRLRSKCA